MLKKGDVVRIETGGGGGYGHPFDRLPASVLEDVLAGLVSPEAAVREYGIAVIGRSVNEAETARLRAIRPAIKPFHRKEYLDVL
jgi:N-methylhydantoinase B